MAGQLASFQFSQSLQKSYTQPSLTSCGKTSQSR